MAPATDSPHPMDDPTLGLAADRYDLIQQQLIPGYGSLARLAVALLAASPLASEPGAEVLVAGCGTGAELQEAVAQRPDWRLGAIDPSAAMRSLSKGFPVIVWRLCLPRVQTSLVGRQRRWTIAVLCSV